MPPSWTPRRARLRPRCKHSARCWRATRRWRWPTPSSSSKLSGHTVITWIWLRQALAAQRGLQGGAVADAAFYRGKLVACRWFYRWELPKTTQWHELLRSLDDTTLTIPPESF